MPRAARASKSAWAPSKSMPGSLASAVTANSPTTMAAMATSAATGACQPSSALRWRIGCSSSRYDATAKPMVTAKRSPNSGHWLRPVASSSSQMNTGQWMRYPP